MDQQYKKDFIRAGQLAREVRAFGKSLIRQGASYNDVIGKIYDKIAALKARPAFPPQIALNDVAAHFLPMPGKDILFRDEVVKLDIGVCYNGAIGDCAVTIDLSGRHQVLIDAAEASLLAAEKCICVGRPLREIGKTIEDTAMSFGLSPIRNLCGHGLGKFKIHTNPTIPNYDNHSTALVRAGMTFAIEPFVTNGVGMIFEEGEPTIFSLQSNKGARSEIARQLLERMKLFDGLPFSMHDLLSESLPLEKVQKGLKELLKADVVAGYAPLVEQTRGLVAQAENSVLVDDDGKVTITTR